MQITNVKIHNFRSFIETQCGIETYCVIVGANNSGKSNFFDAIRWFYGEIKFDPERDCSYFCGQGGEESPEVFVEITFGKIGLADLINEFRDVASTDGSLVIRCVARCKGGKWNTYYEVAGHNGVNEGLSLKSLPTEIFGDIAYIPSINKPVEELKLTGPTALRDVAQLVVGETFEASEEYKDLQSAIRKLTQKVRNDRDGSKVGTAGFIEQELNARMVRWNASFALGFKSLDSHDIVKNLLELKIVDNTIHKDLPLERFGSGFQRNLVCELIRLAAELKKGQTASKVGRILLFEEPESFLHADQQEELARLLHQLTGNGWQIICNTHSEVFVSEGVGNLSSIVRLNKEGNGESMAYHLNPHDIRTIMGRDRKYVEQLKAFIHEKMAESYDELRFKLLLDRNRASLLFARYCLMVEGPTEALFINELIAQGKVTFSSGTVIVDTNGKYNMPRMMVLLSQYRIPYTVIHDMDSVQKEKQQMLNAFLQRLVRCGANERVVALPEMDIETMMGVKVLNGLSKPMSLVSQYRDGKILPECVNKFLRLLKDNIPGTRIVEL